MTISEHSEIKNLGMSEKCELMEFTEPLSDLYAPWLEQWNQSNVR